MEYLVQGWNTIEKQWESLPYQTEDYRTLYVYPVEYMAVSVMKAYAEMWPAEYRVIPTIFWGQHA